MTLNSTALSTPLATGIGRLSPLVSHRILSALCSTVASELLPPWLLLNSSGAGKQDAGLSAAAGTEQGPWP